VLGSHFHCIVLLSFRVGEDLQGGCGQNWHASCSANRLTVTSAPSAMANSTA
jgi:hypothetical protein